MDPCWQQWGKKSVTFRSNLGPGCFWRSFGIGTRVARKYPALGAERDRKSSKQRTAGSWAVLRGSEPFQHALAEAATEREFSSVPQQDCIIPIQRRAGSVLMRSTFTSVDRCSSGTDAPPSRDSSEVIVSRRICVFCAHMQTDVVARRLCPVDLTGCGRTISPSALITMRLRSVLVANRVPRVAPARVAGTSLPKDAAACTHGPALPRETLLHHRLQQVIERVYFEGLHCITVVRGDEDGERHLLVTQR